MTTERRAEPDPAEAGHDSLRLDPDYDGCPCAEFDRRGGIVNVVRLHDDDMASAPTGRADEPEPDPAEAELYTEAQFLLLRETVERPSNGWEGIDELERIDHWLSNHPITQRVLMAGLHALRDDREVQDFITGAMTGDGWEDD